MYRRIVYSLFAGTLFCCVFLAQPAQAYVNWGTCSVQAGEATIPTSAATQNVTLGKAVSNTTTAFVLIFPTGPSGDANEDAHLATAYLSNTTTLTVDRVASPAVALSFTYQVVDCPNNEFTVQTGTISLGSGVASNTATISSVDTTRSFVIVSTRTTDAVADETAGLAYGVLTNATTVTAARSGSPTSTTTVRYQVVTFSAESGVTVQSGSINFAGAIASATATISSVSSPQSWAYCSWNTSNNSLRGASIGCELTNNTTVTVYRHAASNYTNVVQYSVVQFPAGSMNIQRGSVVNNDPNNADGTRYDQDITITGVSAIAKAFPYVTQTVNGTGIIYPRNMWMPQLTSTTNLRSSFFRGDPAGLGDQNTKYWQVIEFLSIPVPLIQSVAFGAVNPAMNGSSYSGSATHQSTSWKIVSSNNCKTGASVWESLSNASALTSITVNSGNGTFMGALAGQTALAVDTGYYACEQLNTSGGSSDWSVAFFFSTNVLPSASVAQVHGGAAAINLSSGVTTSVVGTVTITDTDSCQDVQSVSGVFYRTGAGAPGGNDPLLRYSASCTQNAGTCTGPSDTAAQYTCTFAVQYYADGTDPVSQNPSDDWTFSAKGADEIGSGPGSGDPIEINSLSAMTVSPSVNFGTIGLGLDTGSVNQEIAVTNTGNTRLDMQVSSYGTTPGDGLALQCPRGNMPSSFMKYFMSAFGYGSSGTTFSSSPVEIDFDLMKVNTGASVKTLYTGLKVPTSGVEGACTGTISLVAVYDSIND